MSEERPRPLAALARTLSGASLPAEADRILIQNVVADTRLLQPGDLFVAIRGTQVDGHRLVRDAVGRGAAAVVAEQELDGIGIPVVRVPDGRRALAELAAAWYGHPAERMRLVGITGTLGKTSVLAMLEAILAEAGVPAGTIGSLGVKVGGEVEPNRLTTPDALALQRALARVAGGGAELAAMEVTSHALDQRRVHGLAFELGIFTNLVLLEHIDYHHSFRRYVAAKARFFEHLRPGAPVVFPAGDRAVRALLDGRDVEGIGCGPGGRVSVRVERLLERGGTRISLTVRRPLPRVGGGRVEAGALRLDVPLLGRPSTCNASLATVAGLCLGAEPDAIRRAIERFPAPWRRMQIAHRGRFTVLDDTVGHPDSISAVFDVARRIRHRRLHVAYAIRGRRGAEINRRDAETLALWMRRVPVASLLVTSSEDAADQANRVAPDERGAFLGQLRRYGVSYVHRGRLAETIASLLDRVGEGDLVLLLGAQGMNPGAEWLLQGERARGGPA